MDKVLIANRGEIAVRIIRACRDAGLKSVAVYADGDRDGLPVRAADEAWSLAGATAAATYLCIDKLIDVAARSGADAVHPGYGFLSENADLAEAVIQAGLTWIGPSPSTIRALGDKVSARDIARRVGAPLIAGTPEPVRSSDEIVAFAREHGLPVAIKAAFGGGGRGLKIARRLDEIPSLFESATREAVAAFGRGECFVERYLDRPRHVEAQILADKHGHVVVVGTRDCTLQRRHQKLVEEAPAPFLTEAQQDRIRTSAKAICREARYDGAGTVEYLVGQDGTLSFLEVNTRLQVEHPVTEETSAIDLVREQFRIAAGLTLTLRTDPVPQGHAIEFRINAEDPGRNFLPSPGAVTDLTWPSGPGVRVDAGIAADSRVGGEFDSLLAKIVVSGASREEALERARRVLDETVVEGIATVLPFHRLVVRDPAFTAEPFSVHTGWIENDWTNDVQVFPTPAPEPGVTALGETLIVEVNGQRMVVTIPQPPDRGRPAVVAPRRSRSTTAPRPADQAAVTAPMQSTVVKVAVGNGDTVAEGETIVVLEAMKMEQPLTAPTAGTVSGLVVTTGEAVPAGTTICRID